MREIGIRELKQRTSEVLRRVREGKESIAITHRGRLIAKLIPTEDEEDQMAETQRVWAEIDELAKQIGAQWSAGVSAAEAISEQRREL